MQASKACLALKAFMYPCKETSLQCCYLMLADKSFTTTSMASSRHQLTLRRGRTGPTLLSVNSSAVHILSVGAVSPGSSLLLRSSLDASALELALVAVTTGQEAAAGCGCCCSGVVGGGGVEGLAGGGQLKGVVKVGVGGLRLAVCRDTS